MQHLLNELSLSVWESSDISKTTVKILLRPYNLNIPIKVSITAANGCWLSVVVRVVVK